MHSITGDFPSLFSIIRALNIFGVYTGLFETSMYTIHKESGKDFLF